MLIIFAMCDCFCVGDGQVSADVCSIAHFAIAYTCGKFLVMVVDLWLPVPVLHSRYCRTLTGIVVIIGAAVTMGLHIQIVASLAVIVRMLPYQWLLFPARRLRRRPAAAVQRFVHKRRSFWTNFAVIQAWLRSHNGQWPRREAKGFKEKQLARFIDNQRQRNRRGLPDNEADALESLDGWSWHVFDESWANWLAMVKVFLSDVPEHTPEEAMQSWYPSTNPPEFVEGGVRAQEIQLASWIHKQKQMHAQRRLSEDRQALLEKLPAWRWSSHVRGGQQLHEETWVCFYQELLRWPQHLENSKTQAQPRDWSSRAPAERKLAGWFNHQVKEVRRALAFKGFRRVTGKSHPGKRGRAPMSEDKKQKIITYLKDHALTHLVESKPPPTPHDQAGCAVEGASSSSGPAAFASPLERGSACLDLD